MIGIYFLLRKDKVVYIGKTTRWPNRIVSHSHMNFDCARILECDEKHLTAYEARAIRFFKPSENELHNRPVRRKANNDWILKHSEEFALAIKKSKKRFVSQEAIALAFKAKKELGYSIRTSPKDIWWTLRGRFLSLTNQSN